MSRTRTLLLAIASTLIAAAVLEGIAHLLLAVVPDPSAKRATIAFEDVWAHAEDPLHAPDRDLFWKPVPGRVVGNVRINAHGLRGPDFAASKPPGVRRIVLLGDSVTFGYGVTVEESFAGQLRRQLGPGVEVINAGVTGYSSWQGLRLYETIVREVRPDVLLVLFGYNDHHSAVWSDRDKYRRRHAEATARVAAHSATFRLLGRARAHLTSSDLHRDPVPRVGLDAFEANLVALEWLARAEGSRAFFLTVPIRPDVPLVENFVQVRDPEGGPTWVRQIDLACQQMDKAACDALTRFFFEGADIREFANVTGACTRAQELAQLAPELPIFHYLMAACHAARGDSAAAAMEHAASQRLDRERAVMQSYNTRLRDLARSHRLTVIDVATAIETDASQPLFLDVVHPTPTGHARLASLLEAGLRQHGLLP